MTDLAAVVARPFYSPRTGYRGRDHYPVWAYVLVGVVVLLFVALVVVVDKRKKARSKDDAANPS